MNAPEWTAAQDAELLALRKQGLSSRQCALLIDRSRSAVVGRLWRINNAVIRAKAVKRTITHAKRRIGASHGTDRLQKRTKPETVGRGFRMHPADFAPRPVWHPARDPRPEWLRRSPLCR